MSPTDEVQTASRKAAQRIFDTVKKSGQSPLSLLTYEKFISKEVEGALKNLTTQRVKPR